MTQKERRGDGVGRTGFEGLYLECMVGTNRGFLCLFILKT